MRVLIDPLFIYLYCFLLVITGAVYGMPPIMDRYGMALPMGPGTMVGLLIINYYPVAQQFLFLNFYVWRIFSLIPPQMTIFNIHRDIDVKLYGNIEKMNY